MKKLLPLVLIAIVLAGCSILGGQSPTQSDADMATKVAQILTAQPTPTTEVLAPTAAATDEGKALPTAEPTKAAPADTAVPAATATKAAPAATATEAAPQPTATAAAPQNTATAVPTSGPTPTLVPGDPRTAFGNPTFTDKLDNSDYWPTGEDAYTSVAFRDGMMLMTALTDTDGWRLITYGSVNNFYMETTARFETCSGSDHYGIFARVPEKNPANRGYLVGISCDGKYRIAEWDGSVKPKGVWTTHVWWTANNAILAGANQTNRIGLLAENDRLTFYVNGVKMTEVVDSTFSSGYLGLFVGADETNNMTVQVDEVSIWIR